MQQSRQSTVFGKRKEPHTVIIARGDQIRHFTVRPWLAALAGSMLAAMAIGYLLATTYLVLRDDLIGATVARQARMQQAYEDRISALRAQVDRITSRQLLDQQLMETRMTELLERQAQLSRRHGRIGPILERAEGGLLPGQPPVPEPRPDIRAGLALQERQAPHSADAAALPVFSLWETRRETTMPVSTADRADRLFVAINRSLRTIEAEQLDRVTSLAENAERTAGAIAEALEAVGLSVEAAGDRTGIGGPLVALDDGTTFEARVRELDEALERLDAVKEAAAKLPIYNPAPGFPVSSSFGVRRDPFIGRPAMHSGVDFRIPHGKPVRSSGAGTVVTASWNGGYGRMVEIEHADGLTTRYAHLSRISVKVGQEVKRGGVIGRVGSTGRSTGPHLHYEVRRNGTAVDPVRLLKAGKKVSGLL